MLKIDHIAIWCRDMEKLKIFYIKYFSARPNNKYRNETKNFESYFLSFTSGCRLELMQMPAIIDNKPDPWQQYFGLTHLAISVGNEQKVDQLTEKLQNDGYQVVSPPRTTGDGYYESCILDPEGNRIEIVA